jgi:hypothetical protein
MSMQRIKLLSLAILFILSSCKFKDTVTEGEAGTGDTTITITAPNGGETLSEGGSYQIKWNGTGALLVRVQYTTDNGLNWTLVKDSLSNVGTYSWSPIPNTISNQCKIRITSVDGESTDDSDGDFYIVRNSTKSLKITSPIGGEKWEGGTAKEITWFSSGIDSVYLSYTTDNGQHWLDIGTDKKNTGIFYWTAVPNTPTKLAKVRIKEAKEGVVATESDSTFQILPERAIKVLTPNGGEKWYAGSSKSIIYSSENISNVKLEYTINGGGSWTTIADNIPSTGSFTWNPIPDINSLQCKIRISDTENGGIVSDISDENFSITNPGTQLIAVKTPNGSEKWAAGSTQTISWDASGISDIRIDYTINNGISWDTITTSTPSTGFFTWKQVPNLPSTNCKIRISDAYDKSPSDESDNFFSITPAPTITVVAPNGGETLLNGTVETIQYTSQYVANVKIEYTINGGADWTVIDNSTPALGTSSWKVPNLNSSQCRVRVSDAMYGDPTDMSDDNFVITNVVKKSIKVLSPNGAESWEAGTKHNITWSSTAISKVKVELTTDQGSSWNVLSDSVSSGAFEWDINQNLNSTQCQIRCSDATETDIADVSDATFTIAPRKWLIVTGPQTRIYKSNEPINITWESGGIQYVGIKYTTTNGVADAYNPAFTVLADKVGATSGSYVTYFSKPSDKYFVVVYNADDDANGTPSNNSPGFTIEQAYSATINITQPNGGEQWLASKAGAATSDNQNYHPFEIKWNATNLSKVKIEWSSNGGGNWYVVPGADSTENDGIFVWAPGRLDSVRPDSSDNCKVRISSVGNSISVSDLTDGYFSIHESKKIRIEFPNSGEDFYPPDILPPKSDIHWPMALQWTSYAVSNVNIYYSLDNGVTWNTMATNYQSTGLYAWDFAWGTAYGFLGPIESSWSTLGRIKIVDVSDNKIWDVNDVAFWLNVKQNSGARVLHNQSNKKAQRTK